MKITRRHFLQSAALASLALPAADALTVEPKWFVENEIDLTHLRLGRTIVQFSDLHHRGDEGYAVEIIDAINRHAPDFVVFTGDLVDSQQRAHLPEALRLIGALRAPCYGVLGNHDPVDPVALELFKLGFRATGGDFLLDESMELPGLSLHGTTGPHELRSDSSVPRLLLCHYPIVGLLRPTRPYDFILSGHSHGGQVRLPLVGAISLPEGVGPYVKGSYQTSAGPLYVNSGIGTSVLPIRFLCRPEITIFRT